MVIIETLIAFVLGGFFYVLIEMVWRGRTHWSMALTGGLAMALLHGIFCRYAIPLPIKCLTGAVVISALEFLCGYVCNLRLKLGVWDYSKTKYNLYGQVCLTFTLLWMLLTVPIAAVSSFLHVLVPYLLS